jgi:hypothetical protein
MTLARRITVTTSGHDLHRRHLAEAGRADPLRPIAAG